MKMCRDCRCVRYCSRKCQEGDWAYHREVCAILCNPQPLMIVYPNHWKRALEVTAECPQLLPPPRCSYVLQGSQRKHDDVIDEGTGGMRISAEVYDKSSAFSSGGEL